MSGLRFLALAQTWMPHYLLYGGPLHGVYQQYLIEEALCSLRHMQGNVVLCLHDPISFFSCVVVLILNGHLPVTIR